MSQKTLVSGKLFRIYGVNEYGWNDFLVKTEDGQEFKASVKGELSEELFGRLIEFEGSWNQKYKKYIVDGVETVVVVSEEDGDMSTPGSELQDDVPVAAEPTPVKRTRGRPKKVGVLANTVIPKAGPISSETGPMDDLRGRAEGIVSENIASAQNIARSLGLDLSFTEAITLADMVGRTFVSLKIESGKDRRGAAANASRKTFSRKG